MRWNRRTILSGICLFCLLLSFLTGMPVKSAEAVPYGSGSIDTANDIYSFQLTKNNMLSVSATYHNTSAALESYHTEYLCVTKSRTYGNPRGGNSPYKTFRVGEHKIKYIGDNSVDTFEIPAEEFVAAIREWFTAEELLGPTGVTVYLNDLFVKKDRTSAGEAWNIQHNGKVYDTLDSIRNAASWSPATYKGFENYYDAAIQVRFNETDYEVRYLFTDQSGSNVQSEMSVIREKGVSGDQIILNIPEKVTKEGSEYKYLNRYFLSENENRPGVSEFFTGAAPGQMLLSGEKLVLWVVYAEQISGDRITPAVTPTKGISPVPTRKPEPTVSVAPTKTLVRITPTPEPTRVPGQRENYIGGEYYFTTEEGYTLESIQSAVMKYELAFSIGGVELWSNKLLECAEKYRIGRDAGGNQWFFLENGDNAEYVHPYIYQGNDATTSQGISSISQLVFPEKIKAEGKEYTVRSIGGGTERFHSAEKETQSDGTMFLEDWKYGIVAGNYYRYKLIAAGTAKTYSEWQAEYQYGVMGTGKIRSSHYEKNESSNADNSTRTIRNYTVYNTTLRSVTIPDTVHTILQGAFYGCQALEKITGGKGIIQIEAEAFCGGESTLCKKSVVYENGKDVTREFYYYNESSSFSGKTEIMTKWENQVRLKERFEFPKPEQWTELCKIGVRSFAYHSNLADVVIGKSVKNVGYQALAFDELPCIRVQNKELDIEEAPEEQKGNGHLTLSRSVRFDGYFYDTCANEKKTQAEYSMGIELPSLEKRWDSWKKELQEVENLSVLLKPYYEYEALSGFFYSYYVMTRENGNVWVKRDSEEFYREYELYKNKAAEYLRTTGLKEIVCAEIAGKFGSDFFLGEYNTAFQYRNKRKNEVPSEYLAMIEQMEILMSKTYLERLYQEAMNYEAYDYPGSKDEVYRRSEITAERVKQFLNEWLKERKELCRKMENEYSKCYGSVMEQYQVLLREEKEYRTKAAEAWSKGDGRTVVYADAQSSAAVYAEQWGAYYVMETGAVRLDGRGATKQEQYETDMEIGKKGKNVKPPEKTGYEFMGYYSGVRGSGKCFFDREGKGTAEWTGEYSVLYAFWKQKPVEVPTVPVIELRLPDDERVEVTLQRKDTLFSLKPKDYDSMAVPSSEKLYFQAKTGAWEAKFILKKKYEIREMSQRVVVAYHTVKENKETEELEISETRSIEKECRIPVLCSYWTVEKGGIYIPESFRINCEALAGKKAEIPVNQAKLSGLLPKVIYQSYLGEHIGFDAPETVVFEEELCIVSEVPGEEPDTEAWIEAVTAELTEKKCGTVWARNDLLWIDGVEILSGVFYEKNGEEPDMLRFGNISEKIPLIPPGATGTVRAEIDPEMQNGVYPSELEIIYNYKEMVQPTGQEKKREHAEINSIGIYTPVLCKAVLKAEHEKEHQEEHVPKGVGILVLDEKGKTSDFDLFINNYGFHGGSEGFDEKDYSRFVAEKDGKRRNEVCFPFDVWVDVNNDRNNENDIRIKKNTWYIPEKDGQRFWLPEDTKAGEYKILTRAVAINGAGRENTSEYLRNASRSNHCAYDEISVYVTGCISDFCVTKISGRGVWNGTEEKVLTIGNAGKPQGTGTGGLWNTLPVRNGVHPVMENRGEFSSGDHFEFSIKSVGFAEENCEMRIIPRFYYITDGKREEVQVYTDCDTEKGVVLVKYEETESCLILSGKSDRAVRIWTGDYKIPDTVYAAQKEFDVKGYQKENGLSFHEMFWKKGGVLLLCFEINLKTQSGKTLYYGVVPSKIINNTWKNEAGNAIRTDCSGNEFGIEGGEIGVLSETGEKKKDFSIHGIY